MSGNPSKAVWPTTAAWHRIDRPSCAERPFPHYGGSSERVPSALFRGIRYGLLLASGCWLGLFALVYLLLNAS